MEIGALIVDDQEDIRLLIKVIIEAANRGLFVTGLAASGPDALAQIEELDPAVVVLDEMMPDMRGLDVAQAIRQRRPGQLMIMCSAYLDEDLRRRAEEAGIRICLTKDQMTEIPDALRAVSSGSEAQ